MKPAGLLLFLLLTFSCYSQPYNNWVFGYGVGLRFSTGLPPTPFSGAALTAIEGTASISDEEGNLLFYTDSQIVYNRHHDVMANGTGLLGHASAFQSAVIVQQPNHDSLYYVFTNDAIEHRLINGYRYHIVSTKRDGGLGAVVQKNVPLLATATERLTAVRHANGIDVWVIGNADNSNRFYAWLLTCRGVQAPVISAVGEVMDAHERMNMGALKASADGSLLCQTHFSDDAPINVKNFAQLFDFNSTTGAITNPRKLRLPTMHIYDAEFSPNSAFLYVTDPNAAHIGQLEVKLGSEATINASAITIPAAQAFYAIQAAEDGKIYLVNSSSALSVIRQPDQRGAACAFEKAAVRYPSLAGIGLPSVVKEPFPDPNRFSFTIQDSCTGLVQFNGFAVNPAQTQWEWNFGDGTTSTDQNPQHRFARLNKAYTVTLRIRPANACGYILRSKTVAPGGYVAEAAFTYEVKCDSAFVRFANTSQSSGTAAYAWEFGDGTTDTAKNPVHAYATAGTYAVRLRLLTPARCVSSEVVKQIEVRFPAIAVRASRTEIFETESVQLTAVGDFASVRWSPTATVKAPQAATTLATPHEDITYTAEVRNTAGCIGVDSIRIRVKPLADVHVPSAFTPNGDGKNERFGPRIGHHYGLRRFAVYSRWGVVVFETNQKGADWDGRFAGTAQPSGVYVWTLEATEPGGKLIRRQGTTSLIR